MKVAALLLVLLMVAPGPSLTAGSQRTKTNAAQSPKKPAQKSGGKRKRRMVVRVSPKQRAEASKAVLSWIGAGAGIENAAALVPFFYKLSLATKAGQTGPVRVLHFGDSHTAADEWTGTIRRRLQARFGDAGAGFGLPGRPFLGYRRLNVSVTASRGWTAAGLSRGLGDGLFGLGGVSVTAERTGETLALEADGSRFELYYLRQPGGGSFEILVDGISQGITWSDGEPGTGYAELETTEGIHRIEIRTLDEAPVRLLGWVSEKPSGITYENLGINGAEAPLMLNWNEALQAEELARRDPALIVLAYGTNEAGVRDWTAETYYEAFSQVVARVRRCAPTASILIVGPPDRQYRARGRWHRLDKVDMIVEVQRRVALERNCAFWDLCERMGGRNSIHRWVLAGLAQPDHVHFTADGYRLLGAAMYNELATGFDAFEQADSGTAAEVANGKAVENH
jgi:lysophospholipase L1-like esterase